MNVALPNRPVLTPDMPPTELFTDARQAVSRLVGIYETGTAFLRERFREHATRDLPHARFRAFYPEVRLVTTSFAQTDSRLSFGHVTQPGTYATTVTRPELFRNYLVQQIGLLIGNHSVPISVGVSETPIPLHFAMGSDSDVSVPEEGAMKFSLRDVFDVPDLSTTNDDIVNGCGFPYHDCTAPLAPFTAQRVDYSLARLTHYTATDPEHFQNFVLFTNYQFYVEVFEDFARDALADADSGYTSFVGPGNIEIGRAGEPCRAPDKMPQMPAYHLKRPGGAGITLVNIGVGPSNAKTATDHIAVLRPHAWLMVGHCAGLRNSQRLGDSYWLTRICARIMFWMTIFRSGYRFRRWPKSRSRLRELWRRSPNLKGFELKRVMRTGTVATIDNRNWELRDQSGPVQRLSQSRAIALDMESATVAANGFRFRVPYGTLLCVSDKPLHGELKLPGMASDFYRTQVANHLGIGILAMEHLRETPLERIHSRKLRSFEETAFL